MKILHALGTLFFWMLPVSFVVVTLGKLMYRVPLGEDDLVRLYALGFGDWSLLQRSAGGSSAAMQIQSDEVLL